MGFDLNRQAKAPPNLAQYAADIAGRLPLRPVHKTLLPGIVMHHTLKRSRFLAPNEFCEKVWSAGRWLASYILKHPEEFKNKRVLDLGTGAGIVPIAAALVGGISTAIDGNPKAICLTQKNAEANGVSIETIEQYVTDQTPLPDFDILTTTDTMYSDFIDEVCIQTFRDGAESILANRTIYICDQSGWDTIKFLKFRRNIALTGARCEVIKGGDRFCGPESPINNNPVTAVRIGIAPR